MIWKHALPGPRLINQVWNPDSVYEDYDLEWRCAEPVALLAVSQESRRVAEKIYTLNFGNCRVDLDQDIVYCDYVLSSLPAMTDMAQANKLSPFNHIRHLAVEAGLEMDIFYFTTPFILRTMIARVSQLPSVREVTIVRNKMEQFSTEVIRLEQFRNKDAFQKIPKILARCLQVEDESIGLLEAIRNAWSIQTRVQGISADYALHHVDLYAEP